MTAKEDKQPDRDPFQDPKLKKGKTVSFKTDTADGMARAMIFDELDNHPSHPPSHPSLQQHYSPRSPLHSPYHPFHPGKVQWILAQRSPHQKAGKDTSQSQSSSNP